jgi:asparaginyl-tRNA synthetase
MMDAEMAFHDYKDNMDVQERLMKHILGMVLESHKQELEILERDVTALENARDKDFVRMTHKEAVQQLAGLGSSMTEDEDFGAEDEAILTQQYDVPVFVTHYPAEVKAFYMKRDDSGKYALCSDLLAPEGYGEIIGGSEREADYDTLLKRIQEHELSEEDFSWYLDLRKYGSVPHSGFGYGLERIVRWVCGIHHIRETIPFPRLLNRLKP